MRQLIPSSDIINDLLAENWELRWRVFETFFQTQVWLRDFARSSSEHKQARALCREMAGRLNGASDINLRLILTAAWFLGGNNFLLLALEEIGVDDPETGDLETIGLKKPLINNHPNVSFFDYFHSLLKRNKAVDAATTSAVELFPADLCLTLLCAIPEHEPRLTGLTLLKTRHPKQFFNDHLLKDNLLQLEEKPELLDFLSPSLNPTEKADVANLVTSLLTNNGIDIEYAIRTAGRLQLDACRPQLRALLDDTPSAANALARLGDEEGCKKLLKVGKSWRRKKRASVLSDLAACQTPEVLELLQNRARQGNLDERREALAVLSKIRTPQTLQTIRELLKKTNKKEELKLLLRALAGTPWPGENRETANQLAQWSDNIELYPELLKALAALGYSEIWVEILNRMESPVLQPHHQEIALFMCQFAENAKIRQKLITFLGDIDWSFSFRLLNLLSPQFKSTDVPLLLELLREREELRTLTIKERLTKGRDLERMTDALAEFFQQHPEIANLTIEKLITTVTIGTQPSGEELFAAIKKQPSQLIELLLGPGSNHDAATRDFPLLMAMHILSEIEVDGSDC
ncbi:MAG: hypothetical protein J7M09_00155, partial [Deltaproteobacteria bacterium]|nr:hypothetical protein [Candidatus Tharpella sp.]